MDLQLSGLHAIVTGGSAGIGAAIVHALASEGCTVSFCARGQVQIDRSLRLVEQLPGTVRGYVVDVTKIDDFKTWMAETGHVDIFIPNVSAISMDWAASIQTDIQATVNTTEAVIPYLQKSSHAAITYIGSKAGSLEAPTSAPYGAAKAAMVHYMKSLATRLLPTIRVNTVSPGDTIFDGGLWDRVSREEPETFEKIIKRNPMRRLATAEEIARVVAFISSPAASFVAGANWYVDGGSVNHVQF
ncbi:3-oxoacyl-[acyl-carrier protein] reductase [Undibacterium sp. GrIS 1.8]|uniref:SDR family NAD(P)-dependent oxidoreductase n=1 Tax=Undibacterium sp. GrIS 1.8 TaxID=3143934 RepID=UPI0033929C90